MVVELILQQETLQIHAEALMVALTKGKFRQETSFVVYVGGEEKIEVAHVEIGCGARHKPVCPQLRLALVEHFVVDLPKAPPLNAMSLVPRLEDFRQALSLGGISNHRYGLGRRGNLNLRGLQRL